VSEFLRFKEDLGMSDAEAARNARLSALVHSGMKHSPANEPAILRSGEAETLLQFKRFAFAQFGLGMEMLAQRKYGAVGRWFGINLLLGGLRATIGYKLGAALLASLGVGDDEDEIDDTTRQAVLHGLPTAMGIDMSGSLSLIDAPPGRNWREKLVNATMGPSISTIDRVIDAIAGGQTGPEQTTAAGRAGAAVVQSSPTLKWMFDLLDAIDGEPEDILTPDGRKQYEKTTTDLWVNAFGLRSTDQTVARERVEAIAEFKADRLAAKSAAAQARNSGDLDGMYEAIGEWNRRWPAYRITTDEVRSFARQRAEKAQQGALERAGGR